MKVDIPVSLKKAHICDAMAGNMEIEPAWRGDEKW